jgi:hypothetical protein
MFRLNQWTKNQQLVLVRQIRAAHIITLNTAPGQRIAFLLDDDDPNAEVGHPIFTELEELHGCGENQQWREVCNNMYFV